MTMEKPKQPTAARLYVSVLTTPGGATREMVFPLGYEAQETDDGRLEIIHAASQRTAGTFAADKWIAWLTFPDDERRQVGEYIRGETPAKEAK